VAVGKFFFIRVLGTKPGNLKTWPSSLRYRVASDGIVLLYCLSLRSVQRNIGVMGLFVFIV